MEKLFREVKDLFWDDVTKIIMHGDDNDEYILDLSQMCPEAKLLRAIFRSDDMDYLVIDGIMIDDDRIAVSCPLMHPNGLVFNSIAKRYHLTVVHKIYN